MTLKELSIFASGLTIEHPLIKNEIVELYILACDDFSIQHWYNKTFGGNNDIQEI
jgi:hypothetical protein